MITLYGHPQTRAYRCLWMLEELGVEYEHRPVRPRTDESRSADFLAINPNARVPALVDGDLCLWESMAINLYLARRYGGGLWPATMEDEARAIQWSFWVMTETEAHLRTLLGERRLLPEDQRDPEVERQAEESLARPLAVLDGALESSYLLGEEFGVADLNVASVLSWAKLCRVDLTGVPRVADWLDRCLKRDAAIRARG